MNKDKIKIVLSLIIIITIIILIFIVMSKRQAEVIPVVSTATSSIPIIPTTNSISDGVISFSTPKDFALAVNKDQVLVKSYIPPCDDIFEYCIYYNGPDYKGTNFESAGLAILKRVDLKNINTCLNTSPQGYDMDSTVLSSTTSMFSPLGDAAAGHYSSGETYRLYKSNMCYELKSRIGQTRYENYPEGAIKKFTDEDLKIMNDILKGIIIEIGIK